AVAAPGAAEGPGEFGGALDGVDGVRRTPRRADGQQHGRACGAGPGGGAEELLRLGGGLGGPAGGDVVLAVADVMPLGPEPAGVADRVLDRLRGSGRRSAPRRGAVSAVESE